MVYQGSAAPFYGRSHVDRRNSFYYREADFMGLVQISRLGQLPLQQAARASPGTLITSMQLARAVADGILIPWRKADPERFKSAGELLTVDKGGLVFMPPIGIYFKVAELITPPGTHHHGHPQHLPGDRELPMLRKTRRGRGLRAAGPYPLPHTPSPHPLRE